MNSSFALLSGALAFGLLVPVAMKADDGTGINESTCTAAHFHVNDLTSYAEVREQTLPAAAENKINPGMNGSIRVHGWDKNQVLVKACIQAAAASEAEAKSLAAQVQLAKGAGQIEATGPEQDRGQNWSVSYEIWMPTVSKVDVQAYNGSLRIDAVRGEIRFHTLNGSVHLTDVGGDVKGDTTNGSVTVDLAGAGWTGAGLSVETTNGSVRLNLPDNFSAHVEASTVNGGLHTDFPAHLEGGHNKSLSFDIGSGGAKVEARTVNGSVHIGHRA